MIPSLKFDERKATQVAARFLAAAGGTMPYMSLLKLMYFTDREALLQWGTPVTNDSYYSMDHGPILSRVKDLIVEERLDKGFWGQHISSPQNYKVKLVAKPGDDRLSKAEEILIDKVYAENRHFDQWQLSRISHDLPEWEDPEGTSIPIEIEDILAAGGFARKERETIVRELKGLRKMQALATD
jgi:uncharacterized phage-associated protein